MYPLLLVIYFLLLGHQCMLLMYSSAYLFMFYKYDACPVTHP